MLTLRATLSSYSRVTYSMTQTLGFGNEELPLWRVLRAFIIKFFSWREYPGLVCDFMLEFLIWIRSSSSACVSTFFHITFAINHHRTIHTCNDQFPTHGRHSLYAKIITSYGHHQSGFFALIPKLDSNAFLAQSTTIQSTSKTMTPEDICAFILAIFLPPIGVFLKRGLHADFWWAFCYDIGTSNGHDSLFWNNRQPYLLSLFINRINIGLTILGRFFYWLLLMLLTHVTCLAQTIRHLRFGHMKYSSRAPSPNYIPKFQPLGYIPGKHLSSNQSLSFIVLDTPSFLTYYCRYHPRCVHNR